VVGTNTDGRNNFLMKTHAWSFAMLEEARDQYPMATRRRPERRTSDAAKEVELVVGALRIDGKRREAWVAGRRLALTPTEFSILTMLATDPGRVVRREELVVSL